MLQSTQMLPPNVRNPTKFSENSNIHQFKVIDLGSNQKRICNFLLVISNFGGITYCFRDIDTFCSKIARLTHLTLV